MMEIFEMLIELAPYCTIAAICFYMPRFSRWNRRRWNQNEDRAVLAFLHAGGTCGWRTIKDGSKLTDQETHLALARLCASGRVEKSGHISCPMFTITESSEALVD